VTGVEIGPSASPRSLPCTGGAVTADELAPGQVRQVVVAFARDVGAGQACVERLRLAVTEAVTNVVLHAYPHAGGAVEFAVDADAGDIQVVIADSGLGLRTGPVTHRAGLGLGLIAVLSDDFRIEARSGGGLAIWMRFVEPSI
jgi:serine/threonine-protein kinase RsbW